MVYTDEASWLAAIGAATVTTEDFEGTATGSLLEGVNDVGAFNVNVTGAASCTFCAISPGGAFGSINNNHELTQFINPGSQASDIVYEFDTSILGFAGEWAVTADFDHVLATINGTTFNFDTVLGNPGTGFVGFVDLAGFNNIDFAVGNGAGGAGEYWVLDDAQLATASVPEPASILLMGLGLIGFGFARRKSAT